MKKVLYCIAALAFAAVACNKLETNPSPDGEDSVVNMIIETVSGSRGTFSKATIADADASFAWTVGDHIAVHVSDGATAKYVFTSDDGGSGASEAAGTASFTVAYPEGYTRDAFAVYPSTLVAADAEN